MFEVRLRYMAAGFVVTAASGLVTPKAAAGCSQPSDCDNDAVFGRVVYSDIVTAPERAADGMTSNCCDASGGAGCDDASCESAVVAVDASCGSNWDQVCATMAKDLCNECNGPHSSIFDQGVAEGAPVAFVRVELIGDALGVPVQVDFDITDDDGKFCVCTSGTYPTPNTLKVRAENDFVRVKPSKLVPLPTDTVIDENFHIDQNLYGGGDVDLGDVEIDDDTHTFSSWFTRHPVSRALHVCRAIHTSARHVFALTGVTVDSLTVRLGWTGTAWYDGAVNPLGQTIHLPAEDAAVVWHEYGHHLENRLGAFGVIPSYLFTGGHGLCTEHLLPSVPGVPGVPDQCWPFLEGVASWWGAVNSYGFTPTTGVTFYGDPPGLDGDGSPDWGFIGALHSLGDNWWVEETACVGVFGGVDPRAVEAITGNVLWDLIDDNADPDLHGTQVPEVAEVPIRDVIDVLMADTPLTLGCWGISL